MSEMQLMEYDFDDVDDVKPTVPDVQPARGSKKHKNKKSNMTDVHTPTNDNQASHYVQPSSTTDVHTPTDNQASHYVQPSSAAIPTPSVLEQVTAAFDVLPEFINDTDALTRMLTSLLPLKKGSAAVITGLAAAIIAYYCLNMKEE